MVGRFQQLTEETPVASSFPGFTPESFTFFQELSQHNNKGWFDENRARYEEHVTGAFRALLQTLTPFLLTLNTQFEISGKTNGNFSRINRDIRFSTDKSPYQTYWHRQEGGEWVQHPGLPRREDDWQTLQAWIVRKVYLPNSRAVKTPTFASEVERIFKDLYPLYLFTSGGTIGT
jgi:hypothetical protein